MGMYTELIFGCELKSDTPDEVIKTLQYMIGDIDDEKYSPSTSILGDRSSYMLRCSSAYFGVDESLCKMWKDSFYGNWHISTRSSLKNYNDEIEKFLKWIKPYIEQAAGNRGLYAIAMYEDAENPILYFLDREEGEYHGK